MPRPRPQAGAAGPTGRSAATMFRTKWLSANLGDDARTDIGSLGFVVLDEQRWRHSALTITPSGGCPADDGSGTNHVGVPLSDVRDRAVSHANGQRRLACPQLDRLPINLGMCAGRAAWGRIDCFDSRPTTRADARDWPSRHLAGTADG